MIARLLTILPALFLAVSSSAEKAVDFECGRRPANRVFDSNAPGEVRAATTGIAGKPGSWMGATINRTEYLQTERTKIRLEQETRALHRKVAMLTGSASVIPVAVGLSMLLLRLRKPGPRRFANTNPPRRLGAPHAGGNHAVADLGPPLH